MAFQADICIFSAKYQICILSQIPQSFELYLKGLAAAAAAMVDVSSEYVKRGTALFEQSRQPSQADKSRDISFHYLYL